LPEQYKNINKSTKSLCTKLSTVENNQRCESHYDILKQEAFSVGDVPLTNNKIENCDVYKETESDNNNNTNNQCSGGGGLPCDKLSIKSGISIAASSTSVIFFLIKKLFLGSIRIFIFCWFNSF
jgi:hypothetical protein